MISYTVLDYAVLYILIMEVLGRMFEYTNTMYIVRNHSWDYSEQVSDNLDLLSLVPQHVAVTWVHWEGKEGKISSNDDETRAAAPLNPLHVSRITFCVLMSSQRISLLSFTPILHPGIISHWQILKTRRIEQFSIVRASRRADSDNAPKQEDCNCEYSS